MRIPSTHSFVRSGKRRGGPVKNVATVKSGRSSRATFIAARASSFRPRCALLDLFETVVVIRGAGAELQRSLAADNCFVQIAGEDIGDGGKGEYDPVIRV